MRINAILVTLALTILSAAQVCGQDYRRTIRSEFFALTAPDGWRYIEQLDGSAHYSGIVTPFDTLQVDTFWYHAFVRPMSRCNYAQTKEAHITDVAFIDSYDGAGNRIEPDEATLAYRDSVRDAAREKVERINLEKLEQQELERRRCLEAEKARISYLNNIASNFEENMAADVILRNCEIKLEIIEYHDGITVYFEALAPKMKEPFTIVGTGLLEEEMLLLVDVLESFQFLGRS